MAMASDWAYKARKLPGGRPGARAIHRIGKDPSPTSTCTFLGLNYPEFELMALSIRESVMLDVHRMQYVRP
jgi:hypothetical protein